MVILPATITSSGNGPTGRLLLFEVNGRTDGRTDDGEFNSPPSSLREAGDKKVEPYVTRPDIFP